MRADRFELPGGEVVVRPDDREGRDLAVRGDHHEVVLRLVSRGAHEPPVPRPVHVRLHRGAEAQPRGVGPAPGVGVGHAPDGVPRRQDDLRQVAGQRLHEGELRGGLVGLEAGVGEHALAVRVVLADHVDTRDRRDGLGPEQPGEVLRRRRERAEVTFGRAPDQRVLADEPDGFGQPGVGVVDPPVPLAGVHRVGDVAPAEASAQDLEGGRAVALLVRAQPPEGCRGHPGRQAGQSGVGRLHPVTFARASSGRTPVSGSLCRRGPSRVFNHSCDHW